MILWIEYRNNKFDEQQSCVSSTWKIYFKDTKDCYTKVDFQNWKYLNYIQNSNINENTILSTIKLSPTT